MSLKHVGIFSCFYLHKYKNKLDNRESNLNSRITVEVANIAGYLENVHENPEESKYHKSSWWKENRGKTYESLQKLLCEWKINQEHLLTLEPHGSGMAILVQNSIFMLDRIDSIINHPDGGEEEEDDEETLQVRRADVDVVVCTAADQSAAQQQNV